MSEHDHKNGEEHVHDENCNHDHDHEEHVFLVTDEEGKEREMVMVYTFESEEQVYAVLLDRNDPEADGVIFRIEEEDGEAFLVGIEDDAEWDRVTRIYEEVAQRENETRFLNRLKSRLKKLRQPLWLRSFYLFSRIIINGSAVKHRQFSKQMLGKIFAKLVRFRFIAMCGFIRKNDLYIRNGAFVIRKLTDSE